jgi:NAD(P)-dependent dehydrogenase (short-subunit alcohol dehydrogenase family)
MHELRDKVAVVTGGASGIGRAMVDRFAAEGMKVVVADVEPTALAATERELAAAGHAVLAVVADVAKPGDVDALAERALARFGSVHVLCNNAGVSVGGPMWEHTLDDWRWVLGVNLWGVIHGVRTFVPIMLRQNEPAHVVNTASLAGLSSNPFLGVYNVTKHGVVTLSETLAQELATLGAPIKVSVLCPGFVQTKIVDSNRNRPPDLADGADRVRPEEFEQLIRAAVATGTPPAAVAALVVAAIREDRFYILPHPELTATRVRSRMEDILQGRTPTPAALPVSPAR